MPEMKPSEAVRTGRRLLEGMSGVELFRDFQWVEDINGWQLHYRITLEDSSEFVPRTTDWYVLIEESYPWGYIRFHPAKKDGLIHTFPHQWYNSEGKEEFPFRAGFLCLDTSIHAIGRHGYDREPYTAHERLRWHMERAVEWLHDAIQNKLMRPGDPYELPQFFHYPAMQMVGFSEDATSFSKWASIPEDCGLVKFSQCGEDPDIYVVRSFQSLQGAELIRSSWGSAISLFKEPMLGIWIRLPSVPVLPPWQAPLTWAELNTACLQQGVSIFDRINSCAEPVRDGQQHLALFGFPIPRIVDESPSQIYWKAALLPVLSWKKNSTGFRTTQGGYLERDRTQVFVSDQPILWLTTENWHQKEISTRGRLPDVMTSKHVLLIGAGAVGSVLAEMLVRGGVERLTIIDEDLLEEGNLVRHTLHMGDTKRPKAQALMERLNFVSPHAKVEAIVKNFPPDDSEDAERVRSADIVIDTTANDGLLHHLHAFPWGGLKLFCSFSFGMKAQKLYCYAASGDTFPMEDYRNQINPHIAADKDAFERSGEEMPMEGTGCWHRLFPARIDDIWLLTPVAVKFLEQMAALSPAKPVLSVYEQVNGSNGLEGIRRTCP